MSKARHEPLGVPTPRRIKATDQLIQNMVNQVNEMEHPLAHLRPGFADTASNPNAKVTVNNIRLVASMKTRALREAATQELFGSSPSLREIETIIRYTRLGIPIGAIRATSTQASHTRPAANGSARAGLAPIGREFT